jgi:hypothetical protein
VVPDGGFFGFNTSVLRTNGLIGGLYHNVQLLYDDVIKNYVSDVYVDVIEGYTIATIKLFGWFLMGSLMIGKGAILNDLVDTGRSFDGGDMAHDLFEHVPFLKVRHQAPTSSMEETIGSSYSVIQSNCLL